MSTMVKTSAFTWINLHIYHAASQTTRSQIKIQSSHDVPGAANVIIIAHLLI